MKGIVQRRLKLDSYTKAMEDMLSVMPKAPDYLTKNNPPVSKKELISRHKSRFADM